MKNVPLKSLHFAFVFFIILYATVQILKLNEFAAYPFIYNYLNDLIVIPIIASISLYALWLLKKDLSIRIDLISLISLVVLYSIYFEFYLPGYHIRYTADFWDVVCYITGAIIFYVLQKLP